MFEQRPAEFENWRDLPASHQPQYPFAEQLTQVTRDLRSYPPLVFAGEVDQLQYLIAQAAQGKAFILQGGDCAETFAESNAERIRAKIRTILQMAVVLTYSASVPVVKLGRIAGQYAKPRSQQYEERDGVRLHSYFGDAVNGFDFTRESRTPNPQRLIDAYHRSATTLNLIRAFTAGGFADLTKVHEWNKGFSSNPAYKRYNQLAHEIDKAMRFMNAAGADSESLRTADFFSSHEALLLEYEDAMTRIDSRNGKLYNTGAHFLWIGERTRDVNGAHVHMLSQIENPIGVKLGPSVSTAEIQALLEKLNPSGKFGRLTFITRMGAKQIVEKLPPLIQAVKADGRPVTWICDPMHGNTISASNGYKTRKMSDVLAEIKGFFEVHREYGTHASGVHIELTGADVTEVLGGVEEVVEDTLGKRYETLVDPRLNHQQSLEIAFLMSEILTDKSENS
ncbi:class II 3-deoxy-7-phosphoheptulonate synthase [Arcanobacterium hippocoleae]|uniref:class II 3-deoxy-7-phosphoheptulonate synthase n=1 Tax=Arcanobacterium hippocoleae TaxID=149017 RepID=UPI003341091E